MMPMLRYAITDRAQFGQEEPERRCALVAQAARLAAEGVEFLQLREKDLAVKDLIGLAREMLSAIKGSGMKLLINSRADVALAAGADGVHLPAGPGHLAPEQLTPEQVRRLFARAGAADPTVSVSCHTLAEVVRAHESRADLILFGPVFGKSIEGEVVVPGMGIEALREAYSVAGHTPVLALGGVTAQNYATTIAVGAKGIAAIRLFC